MSNQNHLLFDNLYFLDALAFNFLKAKNFMVENFKKVLEVEKISISLLGIKKGDQSHNLYITNDTPWVKTKIKIENKTETIIERKTRDNKSTIKTINLNELKPSNSSLNNYCKYTIKKQLCKQLSQKIV